MDLTVAEKFYLLKKNQIKKKKNSFFIKKQHRYTVLRIGRVFTSIQQSPPSKLITEKLGGWGWGLTNILNKYWPNIDQILLENWSNTDKKYWLLYNLQFLSRNSKLTTKKLGGGGYFAIFGN